MSYDIYLRCKACEHDIASDASHMGPTYNLTPIFDLALTGEDLPNPEVGEGAVVLFGAATDRPRGLRLLSGKTGAESLPLLSKAQERLYDNAIRATFIALEPKSGWGSIDGAREVIASMRDLALTNPAHVWEIH